MSKHSSQSSIDEGLHRNSDMPLDTNTADANTGNATAGLRKAAVLIPLVQVENQWHVLFIRRADNKRDRHSGQVAFPGGAMDAADNNNALTTALRETFEEIGVGEDQIQPIHELQAYFTISHFMVMPVVGVINWPNKLTLQKEEVSRAFTIPLEWLRDRNNLTLRPRSEVDSNTKASDNPTPPHPIVVYQQYDNEVLWGATARMTLNFIQALDDGKLTLPDRSITM